jgi:hypothetical protein
MGDVRKSFVAEVDAENLTFNEDGTVDTKSWRFYRALRDAGVDVNTSADLVDVYTVVAVDSDIA